MTGPAAIEIDQIVLICSGCKGKRYMTPNPTLKGSQELIKWMETEVTFCDTPGCKATTCDVKCHLKGDPKLED